MPNLKILSNVIHNGIVLKQGVVVSDSQQDIESVAQDLIARGLVKETTEPVTHTMTLVNGAQEPLPVNASTNDGQAPNAEQDDAAKARAKADQIAADKQTQKQVNDQAQKEAETVTVSPTPDAVKEAGPTNEEIQASVANQ